MPLNAKNFCRLLLLARIWPSREARAAYIRLPFCALRISFFLSFSSSCRHEKQDNRDKSACCFSPRVPPEAHLALLLCAQQGPPLLLSLALCVALELLGGLFAILGGLFLELLGVCLGEILVDLCADLAEFACGLGSTAIAMSSRLQA